MTYIGNNFMMAAASSALARIAEAGGQVVGRSALLGAAMRPDSFYLSFDGTDPMDSVTWSAHSTPTIPVLMTAHASFLQMDECFDWMARVVGALPQTPPAEDPLQLLRVESIGPMVRETLTFPNFTGNPVGWTIDIQLRLVVRTGGKVEG